MGGQDFCALSSTLLPTRAKSNTPAINHFHTLCEKHRDATRSAFPNQPCGWTRIDEPQVLLKSRPNVNDSEKKRRRGTDTAVPEEQVTSDAPASAGAMQEDESPEGCPMVMFGKHCGRPIHLAPNHDAIPVCLMHSRDPQKSDADFQKEFETILKAAGNGIADFSGFVFPSAGYQGREFKAKCVFSGATFTQAANFYRATFTQDTFFSSATFAQYASFGGATFTQNAGFYRATFTQNADFVGATFTQYASFGEARFAQNASFIGATFTQKANFGSATFVQKANFKNAKFLEAAEFRETKFRGHDKDRKEKTKEVLPGSVFSLAEFSQPEKIVFYKTYLGQALFHNCDVSKVNFSLVTWRPREHSGKRMVLEEQVDLQFAEDLKPAKGSLDDRRYRLIAELYQQLKKNYDERKDYWTAGDFHYGEMEMKRRSTKRPGNFIRFLLGFLGEARMNRVRSWWHPRLSLVAWYKYTSEYGESYMRPLAFFVLVLLLFALLFPLPGLDRNERGSASAAVAVTPQNDPSAAAPALSYGCFPQFLKAYPGHKVYGGFAFFGHSLMTALSVAGFQKELKYEPSYPWGRALALAELLLTSTLIGLFLLAVRRQFRR